MVDADRKSAFEEVAVLALGGHTLPSRATRQMDRPAAEDSRGSVKIAIQFVLSLGLRLIRKCLK